MIRDYSGKLLNIGNDLRLMGSEFSDSRNEASIIALENTRDFSKISVRID